MKILAVAVISLTFLYLLPFSLGKVDRYKMSIVEKGTPFTEKIEVDEKQDVEVFRVPAHNDVNAADFYHDFKMRVTVTKDLTRKVCYIANMDPSMPSPQRLKADIALAASQPGELPVITQEHLMLLTGPANRLLLTKEILDFCGALPIYNTEVFENPVKEEDGTFTVAPNRRQRRQNTNLNLNDYTSCIHSLNHGSGNPLQYVIDGGCINQPATWQLRCRLKRLDRNCYFYVTCYKTATTPAVKQDSTYKCVSDHRVGNADYGFCCDPKCPPKQGK